MVTHPARHNLLSKLAFLGFAALPAIVGCSKTSNTSSTAPSTAPTESVAVAPTVSTASADSSVASGAQTYASNCSSCHQINGQGVPGTFPPLAGNPIVVGDPKKVIHIVKYGLTGPVRVAGNTYNGQMPAWSSQLSEAAIASVITYIRSSWGNHAGPVIASQVTAVSK